MSFPKENGRLEQSHIPGSAGRVSILGGALLFSTPVETLPVVSTRLHWACGFILRMLPKAMHRDWQVWGQNVEEGNCMETLSIEAGMNPQPCPKDGIGELESHWWRWWEQWQWREDRNCVWGYLVQAGGGERQLFLDAWLEKEVAELVVKMETRGKKRWTLCVGNSSYLKLTLHLYSKSADNVL